MVAVSWPIQTNMLSNSCLGNKRSNLKDKWTLAAFWASSLSTMTTYNSTLPKHSQILNMMEYSLTREAQEDSHNPRNNPLSCSIKEETLEWWWCKDLCLNSPIRITQCKTSTNSSQVSLNSLFEACKLASPTTCQHLAKDKWWTVHNINHNSTCLRTTSEADLLPRSGLTTTTSTWSNLLEVQEEVPTLPISCKWCNSNSHNLPIRVALALSMLWLDSQWCRHLDAHHILARTPSNRSLWCLPT